jgi:hypothetical protein
MFVLPNSRENEQEAARIGVELTARAGYDRRGAVSLWNNMGQRVESKPPQLAFDAPVAQGARPGPGPAGLIAARDVAVKGAEAL